MRVTRGSLPKLIEKLESPSAFVAPTRLSYVTRSLLPTVWVVVCEFTPRLQFDRSPEEFAPGEYERPERKRYEDHLVNVILSRRQSADEMGGPKDGVVTETPPRPAFAVPERGQCD